MAGMLHDVVSPIPCVLIAVVYAGFPILNAGVGTIYDLRHFSIPTFPPNRARWDYHVTHINLMTAMSSIDKDPVFPTLRERWLGYMVGRSTKHN